MASIMPDPGMMPPDPGMGAPMGPPPPDPMMGGLPPEAMGPPPGPPPEEGPPDLVGMMAGIPAQAVPAEDWIRMAVEAAKKAADSSETDDLETGGVQKAIMELMKLLGGRQKEQEALMGGGPATKALSRAYGS